MVRCATALAIWGLPMLNALSLKKFIFKSFILVSISCIVAVTVNIFRPTPLEWVASEQYEIFTDCPETTKTSKAIAMESVSQAPRKFLLVDARPGDDFEKKHLNAALSLPYDPIFSVDKKDLKKIEKAANGRTVVVYGGRHNAKLLADDLVSQGISKVRFLKESDNWESLYEIQGN